jgi:predicted transcriptional regulator
LNSQRDIQIKVTYMKRRSKANDAVQLPTEAELEILNILWALGPSTVRDVHTALGKDTGYTTVLKQMQVMAEKGLLERSESARSHVYEPCIAKQKTQQRLARNLLQRAFDGSAKSLVLGALSAQKVSSTELAEIRGMLDEFEKRGR